MKTLQVLLIAPTCDGDDVGEAWVGYQWVKHLRKNHEVTLLTYNKRGVKPASQQFPGLRVVEWSEPSFLSRAERLNSIVKPGYIPFYFRARSWLQRALARGERFDVVHQPLPVAMRYPSPAAGMGIPLVMGPVGGGLSTPEGFAADEGSSPWFMKLRSLDRVRRSWDPLLRRTYQDAACVLGIAPYVKEELRAIRLRRFEVLSETGLETVPGPIDRSNRPGKVHLLYVGRLVRTKGARDIIRALGRKPGMNVQLDIVGDGPERAHCENLVKSLGLADQVTLHGWKAKNQVMEFYQNADIFVFPSYREPGGNVALEAMAHSLPLIVVDRGGPGSAVSDACAIKLPVTTPDALAEDLAAAIEKLASDAPLRRKMGAEAYDHVRRVALWEAKIAYIDTLFAELANSARGSHNQVKPGV